MKIIAVISQKGGAGKTTLAVNLAVAAELLDMPTVLVDLDPQSSAKTWHDIRVNKEAPFVVSAQASRLEEVIAASRSNGAELMIIDTAPHSESTALAAARAADLVLIPCRPAILDLKAIGTSGDLAALAKKEAVVVLNAVPHQGKLAEEAEEAVRSYGLSVAPVKLTQRAAYVHSLTAGQAAQEFEPEGKAAPTTATVTAIRTSTPSRVGKKTVAAHFDPAVSRQLKQLGLDHDTSTQALLREAINDLFTKYGKPPIA